MYADDTTSIRHLILFDEGKEAIDTYFKVLGCWLGNKLSLDAVRTQGLNEELTLDSFYVINNDNIKFLREKSVSTTERHYCTKKREHSFSILKALKEFIFSFGLFK